MKVNKYLSRSVIKSNINSKPARPYPFSMYSELAPPKFYLDDRKTKNPIFFNPESWKINNYTSWESLKNKEYNNRLLPTTSKKSNESRPSISKVANSLMRGHNPMLTCHRTSVAFMGFAQWFTDAFFSINPLDLRKNTSTHEIDLCQIYGLNKEETDCLREKKGGKLKSQFINNQEYPPFLLDENLEVKTEFKNLSYSQKLKHVYHEWWSNKEKVRTILATGLEKGNSTISHVMMNSLFLRLHNKTANILEKKYNWNDERVFQTTRNILIVILIKIVIQDYVNHLKPFKWMSFEFDNSFAHKQNWYRNNWISTEFNLLYRWHSMIPDSFTFNKNILSVEKDFRFNNNFVFKNNLVNVFEALSNQKAGKMTLKNTPNFMEKAEYNALFISRASKLKPFVDYCKVFSGSMANLFGENKIKKMSDITTDKDTLKTLIDIYGNDVSKVDLTIGALAQDPPKNIFYEEKPILGNLMLQMIASDAFSHALTNPLLAENIYNESTFSKEGVNLINAISTLKDVVDFSEGVDSNIAFNYNKVLKY